MTGMTGPTHAPAQPGSVRVANLRTLKVQAGERAYYIGRGPAPHGTTSVHLGNPYRVGEGYAQGEAATKYDEYLRDQCRRKTQVYETIVALARELAHGQDIVLVCWCDPQPCHGHAILRAVQGYARALHGWRGGGG